MRSLALVGALAALALSIVHAQPTASQFGLTNSWGTLHGQAGGESGLIDGHAPYLDVDLMLPWGAHQVTHLPGDGRDSYTLTKVGFIQGSGAYATFSTPNGGRFAMLHLSQVYLVQVGRSYPGGTLVGVTGWPWWSEYAGGGPGGEGDSHLCVIEDWPADQWFDYLRTRPAVRPFPWTYWERWGTRHQVWIPANWHGRLTAIARSWMDRQDCGPATSREVWVPKYRASTQTFKNGCRAWSWPTPGNPVVWVKS